MYARITWKMVTDHLGSAEHTLGTTLLEIVSSGTNPCVTINSLHLLQ
jgi:hypothetical protein